MATPEIPIPGTNLNRRPWKIVSGGQTGVDCAGLVAAMALGIPHGGWVPRGRLAEDGVVPEEFYGMRESRSSGYRWRTRANIVDSDATLILVEALPLTGGTFFTAQIAEELRKPRKVVRLGDADAAAQIRDWMLSLEDTVRPGGLGQIVLNVAGPRESKAPGIFERARRVLETVFAGFRGAGLQYSSAADDSKPMAAESTDPYDANGKPAAHP